MKKNGFHIIFTYFVGCCMLFTSAGALAEGGGGGGGSGEIILPVGACGPQDLGYMITTVSPEPVLCSELDLVTGLLATNGTFPPDATTDPDALCTVYTYTPDAAADKFSLPVRAELPAGIYGATTLTFHEPGIGDAAQYLKGDILHRVAEIDAAGTITIVVASNFPPENMIVRFKNQGGGNLSNYCTADAPARIVETIFQTPIVSYENTLKVEERVVKNGKCNVRIEGTCENAAPVGWKCTAEGKAFVLANPGELPCQTDEEYVTDIGIDNYCEPKIVDNLELSAKQGGDTLFTQKYFDGEEQCYNENPITNAGEASFSCLWWTSPLVCF